VRPVPILHLIVVNVIRQDFTTCLSTIDPPRGLVWNDPKPPGDAPGGFQCRRELLGLGPREIATLNAWHARTGLQEPTRTWQPATLTSDKNALVKAAFSIRDSVHQGFGQSTPHHVSLLGASHYPSERHSHAALLTAVRWDRTTPIRRLYTREW
jgi:hypothetical protein